MKTIKETEPELTNNKSFVEIWLEQNFNPVYLPAILIGIDWANQASFWQGIITTLSLILSITILQKSERSLFNKRYRINLLVFILLAASVLNLLTILGFSKTFSPDENAYNVFCFYFYCFFIFGECLIQSVTKIKNLIINSRNKGNNTILQKNNPNKAKE